MARVLLLLIALLTACSSPPSAPVPVPVSTEVQQARAKPAPGPVQSFTWDGLDRSYRVHLPSGFDESREYPMVLVLHAARGTARGFERQTGFNAIADERGFIVVYGEGTGWGGADVQVWNAGQCCGDAAAPLENVDDVGYAREVVRQMSDFYRIDRDKVFVTGLSNGGMMAHRLACEASDVFRGIAAVAGTIQVEPCEPGEKLPVLIVHGTADTTVPYRGGPSGTLSDIVLKPVSQTFAEWAAREGCDGDLITTADKNVDLVTYQRCDQRVQLLRINGGGHEWPSGTAQIVTDFFQL